VFANVLGQRDALVADRGAPKRREETGDCWESETKVRANRRWWWLETTGLTWLLALCLVKYRYRNEEIKAKELEGARQGF
jgi:hypothetical protein